MNGYRISQLSERVGIPATTLRYYEARGLLPARRTPAGYRTYSSTDVERVRFIATAKNLGLSLDDIRDILGIWQHGMCRDVRDELTPRLRTRIEHAEHRIAELQTFRDHLRTAMARLEALPARDSPCDPACAFVDDDASDRSDRPPQTDHAHTGPAIACTLTAQDYTDRASRWRAALAGATRWTLPGAGLRIQLPTERAEEVAALVAAESRCCPFLTFRLTFTAGGIELDAHAPAEATPLLHDLLAPAEEATSAC
ncbi:MAG: MerR family transcriptional regulator [Pseudonocardia sp.]|nr:MerR family transcriptional regulator [Pseudonocardia sp.]